MISLKLKEIKQIKKTHFNHLMPSVKFVQKLKNTHTNDKNRIPEDLLFSPPTSLKRNSKFQLVRKIERENSRKSKIK